MPQAASCSLARQRGRAAGVAASTEPFTPTEEYNKHSRPSSAPNSLSMVAKDLRQC